MGSSCLDDDDFDRNIGALDDIRDALERARDISAGKTEALEHIHCIRMALDDCIDAATDIWRENDNPIGRALKEQRDRLVEIDHDLSRLAGIIDG